MIEWGSPLTDNREQHGSLNDRFVVPPFSVLDTRQGYWQDRRRAWLALGIKGEMGRGDDLLQTGANSIYDGGSKWSGIRGQRIDGPAGAFAVGTMHDGTEIGGGPTGSGTSIFDPVLCELTYRWFAPERGHVLDPFAGGSVRGIVAARLGHPYTGIDLSDRQLWANRTQAEAILSDDDPVPHWLCGDSQNMDDLLPAGQVYDLVFSCPPYYDLEVYSDDPADLSAASDYATFLDGYGMVIAHAAERLRPERFVVLVVSEIRDKDGYCRGLVPDTITLAKLAGLRLYNEAVLINSAGSLPLRAGRYMEASRKLGRTHQNVLVFAKGKPERGWSYERQAPPDPQLALFDAALIR